VANLGMVVCVCYFVRRVWLRPHVGGWVRRSREVEDLSGC
jgi:hypothetical protein